MLLPDTQLIIAQQHIKERLQRFEQYQRERDAIRTHEEKSSHEEAERGWLRQFFLGKSEA